MVEKYNDAEKRLSCACLAASSWSCSSCEHTLDCDETGGADYCEECGHEIRSEVSGFSLPKTPHAVSALEPEPEPDLSEAPLQKPSNAGKYWTADEDERLIGAYSGSRNFSEMAIARGRSEKSIWMRLVHLSFQEEPDVVSILKSRKFELSIWKAGQIEVLTTSYAAGVSLATLAEVLELNIVDVARKVVELGLAEPKTLPSYRQRISLRRWPRVELTQLRDDFRNKLPLDLVAENSGRSMFAVLNALYTIGEITDSEATELILTASSKTYVD